MLQVCRWLAGGVGLRGVVDLFVRRVRDSAG
jgi:hypothetical protein